MSMNANEPAYPCPLGKLGEGLTKREYFAGIALQGLLSNTEMLEAIYDHTATEPGYMEILSKASVQVADALLAELERKP